MKAQLRKSIWREKGLFGLLASDISVQGHLNPFWGDSGEAKLLGGEWWRMAAQLSPWWLGREGGGECEWECVGSHRIQSFRAISFQLSLSPSCLSPPPVAHQIRRPLRDESLEGFSNSNHNTDRWLWDVSAPLPPDIDAFSPSHSYLVSLIPRMSTPTVFHSLSGHVVTLIL